MKQRRTRRDFTKFPTHTVDTGAVLEDIRSREYLSKFSEFHVRTVFYLALLGMTEQQIAVVFDISVGTLQTWKHKFPTFLEALQKGREQADAAVVYSLYQAAIGYSHPSEQVFCSREKIYDVDDKGKTYLKKEIPRIVRVPITKQYPPSVKAAIKWLETRQPAVWSTRPSTTQQLSVTQNNYDLKGLTLEQLKVLRDIRVEGTDQNGLFRTTAQQELEDIEDQTI